MARNDYRGTHWAVPKLWPGTTCYILGGGPSLSNIDVDRLRGQRVIAVNDAFKLRDWFDVMFYGDRDWLTHKDNHKQLMNFAGLKVTIIAEHLKYPDIKVVQSRFDIDGGVSIDPRVLVWKKNSGMCAINLAVLFGVKKVILLGFDMRRVDGRQNWHDWNRQNPPSDIFDFWLHRFKPIARDLKTLGVECVNATPGSALTLFPIVEPDEVLPC